MSPGDLVVCVNNSVIPGAGNTDLHLLVKGDVYTVEDCVAEPHWRGARGVKVIEAPIPPNAWWVAERFRQCRKTNIDCLTASTKERDWAEA